MTARRWLLGAVAAAALLLAGRAVSMAVLDHRVYQTMGAGDVWWSRFTTILALRAACAFVAAAFAFANLLAVRHSVVSLVLPRRVGNIEIGEEVPGRSLVVTAAMLAAVLGVALALPMDGWTSALLARHGRPFGESDPYFQRDLGFFVYWLPFETTLYHWSVATVAVVIVVVVLLYALTPSLRWERRTLYVSGYVRRHLLTLGGVLLLALAWSYRLDNYELLIDRGGLRDAFTSVDHRVGISGTLIMSLVSVAGALVVLFAAWTGQTRIAFLAVTGVLVAAATLRVVAPALARGGRLTDAGERPYQATRAGYSRRAFAVERIQRSDSTRPLVVETPLRAAVSSWDALALRTSLLGSPAGESDDVDRGALGWSRDAEGMVASYPAPSDPSEDGGSGWSPVRLRAASADANGEPVHILAPDGAGVGAGPLIVRPGRDGHAIIADRTGSVIGIPLASRAARLTYAWALQDLGVAGARAGGRPAVLVLRRDVRARIHALVPFLVQGGRVTPFLVADSVYWAVDLYAAARTYPLSQPLEVAGRSWTYFHRGGVALVHAQTGRTLIVADSGAGPIFQSWRDIFPRLFVASHSLPLHLRAALPPATDELRAQTTTFTRFGSRLEGTAVRVLPGADGADSRLVDEPTPVRLRDGHVAEVLPVLDAGDRIAGVMIAVGGAERRTVWQPMPTNVRWPAAIERLRSATAGRSPVVRGPVRVVPLHDHLALVQSSYAWRDGRPPSLARVAVLSKDSLRSATSLAALGDDYVTPPTAPATGELHRRTMALYEEMRAALRRGDMTTFGRLFDSLGLLLQRPAP